VLPVLWEDNYVTLLPGETRELAATYAATDLGSAAPALTIDGWNVAPATVR
jgi:exo-1,4-beta-D-glucosaminidase